MPTWSRGEAAKALVWVLGQPCADPRLEGSPSLPAPSGWTGHLPTLSSEQPWDSPSNGPHCPPRRPQGFIPDSRLRAVYRSLQGISPSSPNPPCHLRLPPYKSCFGSGSPQPATRNGLPAGPPAPSPPRCAHRGLFTGPSPLNTPGAAPWTGPSRTLLVWRTAPLPSCGVVPGPRGACSPHLLGSPPTAAGIAPPLPPLTRWSGRANPGWLPCSRPRGASWGPQAPTVSACQPCASPAAPQL